MFIHPPKYPTIHSLISQSSSPFIHSALCSSTHHPIFHLPSIQASFYSFISPYVYPFSHPYIQISFIHSSLHSFICPCNSLPYSTSIHPSICPFTSPSSHPFISPFISIQSSIHLFMIHSQLFMHPLFLHMSTNHLSFIQTSLYHHLCVDLVIHLFILSCIHLFPYNLTYSLACSHIQLFVSAHSVAHSVYCLIHSPSLVLKQCYIAISWGAFKKY